MQWITLFLTIVGVGTIVITETHQLVIVSILGLIFGMLLADFYRALTVNKRAGRSE